MSSLSNNVYGTFISQKVSKIRWRPNNAIDTFITGSWDDQGNKINVWKYITLESEDALVKPKIQCSIDQKGDITEIKFIDHSTFVVSSSHGCIMMYQLLSTDGIAQIKTLNSWEKTHFHETDELCPATDFDVFEDNIISVGEDGRIVIMKTSRKNEISRCIDNADGCIIRCVSVNNLNEVLTGNSSGQMKVWDFRSYTNVPETSFTLTGGQSGFTRVIQHPSQTHIKLAGGEDGTITIWDLRNNKFAVNSLHAHSQSVAELMFHPDRPEHLFSCSGNGQLWHWDSSKLTHNTPSQFLISSSDADLFDDTGCPWMSKNVKNRITVYSLIQNLHLSINSLDVQKNSVICGCDNEAIYLIRDFVTCSV